MTAATHSQTFSWFEDVNKKNPSDSCTLAEWVSIVRSDDCRELIDRIRSEPDKNKREKLKKLLPSVTFSVECETRDKEVPPEARNYRHTGILQIDVDTKDNPGVPMDEIRQKLMAHPSMLMVATSPSGGLKAAMAIPPHVDTHKRSFDAAKASLAAMGVNVDGNTHDVPRMCYLTHDPDAWLREGEAQVIEPLAEVIPPATPQTDRPPQTAEDSDFSLVGTIEDVRHVLFHIPAWPERDEWLRISNAVRDALGEAAAIQLLTEWSPEPEPDGYAKLFKSPLKEVHAASLVSIARGHGYDSTAHAREIHNRNKPAGRVKLSGSATTSTALDSKGDGVTAAPKTVSKLDAEELRARAYAMRFDPNEVPPPDETCMVIGDVPIAARGNLTVPQGKSKVGKSALISAILGAAHRGNCYGKGDTLCVEWQGDSDGAIIHLDTEQSRADWHALVCRGVTRSGLPETSPRLVSLPLVMFSRSERLAILKQTLAFELAEKGVIDLVLIDGVADLCISPNDEAEALELVSQLHALAQEYDCPIICVLHENPGSEIGKTRGHLGSELNRKAFANLRIDKDTETSVSTIYGTDMRKRDIPKEQGFCFAWDEVAQMHTFQGRAAGLKAAQRELKATAECREKWRKIFEFAADSGTNGTCPALTPKEAAEMERDMSGTEELTKNDTMRKRMERAEILGVLKKFGSSRWSFTPSGTSGT